MARKPVGVVFWTTGAFVLLLAVASLSLCRVRHIPAHAHYRADFPPSMLEEVERMMRRATSKRGLYLHTPWKGRDPLSDGLETLSLWVLPSEKDLERWVITLHRDGTTLTVAAFDDAGLTYEELDSFATEVHDGLEDELNLTLCDIDSARGVCVRPDAPRLLYRMDFVDGRRIERPGQVTYDLAKRHGVRMLPTWGERLEKATGVEGALEERFFPNSRAFARGEFPMVLASGEAGGSLRLSVFDRGGMPPDALDALARDAIATLESRYGRSFCRANPATEHCDAEHAALERQREAWLEARATDAAAVEAFLAAWPESPHADAARERVARLRGFAKRPPSAPPGPAEQWVGRRPGGKFADTLPDGAIGPEMTVAPAGVFRMGCLDARRCPLDELPVHEVRVARPFALSTREVTHAEYFRFARPRKRLDPTWADRPATHLTWAEAAAYAAWLAERTGAAYRLPSEAEWEWVARAGTTTAYAWGDEMEGGRARCHECPWPQPTGLDVLGTTKRPVWVWTVGAYPANLWGFHDMHGNAAEWTADCWHPDHLGAPADGSARTDGDCSRRVVRGGSYDTPQTALRSSARVGKAAGERYLDVGFRVLRELRNMDAWGE